MIHYLSFIYQICIIDRYLLIWRWLSTFITLKSLKAPSLKDPQFLRYSTLIYSNMIVSEERLSARVYGINFLPVKSNFNLKFFKHHPQPQF